MQRRSSSTSATGWRTDLATFDAVAAHRDLRVAVDAHWAYDLADALRLGRALDERGAWFLEAPLAPEDVDGHRELAAALATPVAIGETLRNRFEFSEWLQERALDLAQPDVGRTGHHRGRWRSRRSRRAHHVPVAPHHSVGLGVALAAGIHVAAAIEAMPVLRVPARHLRRGQPDPDPPLTGGPGAFHVPTAPGLGIEVDITALLEDQ